MGCEKTAEKELVDREVPLKWSYIRKSTFSVNRSRSSCECFHGLWAYLFQENNDEERQRFETTVAFLRSVPLFRRQLPSCELPKLARDLKCKTWRPGEKLVRQEEVGRAFYLIQSGRASVLVTDCEGKEHVRATLIAGDYFGGHTLVAERINNCSVVAQGPELLVTLSVSRKVFDSSGLKDKLFFPKRPALVVDRGPSRDPSMQSMTATEKTPQEQAFLLAALKNNVNLRALHDVSNEVMQSIAAAAVSMIVPKGTVVAQSGTVGQEFFVIKRGTFHAIAPESVVDDGGSRSPKSAEATVAQLTMSERLKRKQNFLKSLNCRKGHQLHSRLQSQSVRLASTPRGPKAMSEWADDFNPFKGSWLSSMVTTSPPSDDWRTPCSTVASKADLFQMALFQVGDRVKMQPEKGETDENIGTVTECGRDCAGRYYVKVSFVDQPSEWLVDPEMLTLAEDPDLVAELGCGESFGELSLIYNTFREATFKAVEESEVYVISRRHFKAHFNRKGHQFKDYCTLLDEVPVLWPLLQAERWELACNALGLFTFRPGERIITQGVQRKAALWYIIFSGSCVVSVQQTGDDGKEMTQRLSKLRRPGHFGERSLLRGGDCAVPEVSVHAGSEGMVCLAFEGQAIRVLLETLIHDGAVEDGAEALLPNVQNLSSTEYEVAKASRKSRAWSTEELPRSHLEKVCMLGSGGFAKVFLMEEQETKKRYALKCISKGHVEKHDAVRQVCWEREMLMMVDSPFVIRLVRSYKDAEFIYILLEAALGGSLYQLMTQKPEVFLDDQPRGSSTAFFVGCIIAALEHMHDRRIVYRDLKPENVMLDERGYGKLCDMGFARFVINKTNTLAGTPEYMAPEVIDFPHAHDTNCDWWSLGVLTYELNAGHTPWDDEGLADLFGKLLAIRRSQERGEPRYPFSCPLIVRNFISKLLQKLPRRLGARRGAKEIREHIFFQKLGFDFQALKAQTLPPPIARPFARDAVESGSDIQGELRKGPLFCPVRGESRWDEDF